jgi:polyribonucleotide nucleotidyltransferase
VVASKSAKPGQDFFPLTVDYIEKTYAAGKIPGSFFKREAKPSEHETLTSRLIDRPIRPLFPKASFNEVHVVIHTLSLNPEVDADIAAMIGSSAALAISGIPFAGPIGAARVGYSQWRVRAEPGQTARKDVRPGPGRRRHRSRRADGGIRSPAAVEEIMLGAVVFGHDQGNIAINAIHDLVREAGKPVWDWKAPPKDESFIAKVNALAEEKLACRLPDPQQAGPHPGLARNRRRRAGRPEGRRLRVRRGQAGRPDVRHRSQDRAQPDPVGRPRIDGRDTRTVPSPSRSAPACCPAPTARLCSPAAKPRHWW